MVILSDSISSKNWLVADNEIKLNAYVDNFMPASETSRQVFLDVFFPIDFESSLDNELKSWDFLSDEALYNFEQDLT